MPEDLLELDQTTDEPEPLEAETAEPSEEITGATETEAAPEGGAPISLFAPDGRKLSEPIKATLTKLKTESPEVAKVLTKAVFRVAELDREFPGGLVEARELRDKVESLGGVQGIEEKLAGVAELNNLAEAFMKGDQAFVDDMVASSPEAFSQIAPLVFAKYSEVNPDGFSAYLGRVVYGDLARADVPLLMMRLNDVLGDNAKAQEIFGQLNAYLGKFKTLAEKQPAAPRPNQTTAPKNDTKREEDLRSREWKIERDDVQRSIRASAYTSALQGRKANAEDRADIQERFGMQAKSLADRLFPGWQDKSQRFIKTNDKAGYLRYMKSIYTRVFPEAMATAVNKTMRGRTTAARTEPSARPGATKTAAPPAGFVQIAKEPGTHDIDYGRTNGAMIRANQAVLKDGKKVQWQ